jgi:PhnB protein
MAQLNPYVSFDGNAEEAFNLYKSVFGGEFPAVMRWGDNPQCAEMSDADKNKIMHISLPVGDGVIMASDHVGGMGEEYKPGNNFAVAIAPSSREEAERFFAGLSEGGKDAMPMQDMFWGGYYGHVTDKFGVRWMINYDEKRA